MVFMGCPTSTSWRTCERRQAGKRPRAGWSSRHLGNGASMAAVLAGKGIDTTMGLTPAGGLMMGTRSGDLDPGRASLPAGGKGPQPGDRRLPGEPAVGLDRRVGQQFRHARSAGPRGRRSPRRPGRRAVLLPGAEILGAMAAVLGGLDTLVFTAGVGTNAPTIRQRICRGLEFMGIRLDPDATKPTPR